MEKRILLEVLITEREGMVAQNAYHIKHYGLPEYNLEHFQYVADKMRALLVDEPSGEANRKYTCNQCGYNEPCKLEIDSNCHLEYCPADGLRAAIWKGNNESPRNT